MLLIKVLNCSLGLGDLKYRLQWTDFNFPELFIWGLSFGMNLQSFGIMSYGTVFSVVNAMDVTCVRELHHNFYRPHTKLRKGYVFTPVCYSVRGGRGVSAPVHAEIQPLGRHPPRADPPRQTPPSRHRPADGYCCGRYASYWNAFLLQMISEILGRSILAGIKPLADNVWKLKRRNVIIT